MKRRMFQFEFAEPVAGSVNVMANSRKKHLDPRLLAVFDDLYELVGAVAVFTLPAVLSVSAFFSVKPLSPQIEAKHECTVEDQVQDPGLGSGFLGRMLELRARMFVRSPAFRRLVWMIGHGMTPCVKKSLKLSGSRTSEIPPNDTDAAYAHSRAAAAKQNEGLSARRLRIGSRYRSGS
jgi:hypothetical protein